MSNSHALSISVYHNHPHFVVSGFHIRLHCGSQAPDIPKVNTLHSIESVRYLIVLHNTIYGVDVQLQPYTCIHQTRPRIYNIRLTTSWD